MRTRGRFVLAGAFVVFLSGLYVSLRFIFQLIDSWEPF